MNTNVERNDYYRESWEHALLVLQRMDPHERERHFDMTSWGFLAPCGTVACLVGHCSLDSWFHEHRTFRGVFTEFNELIFEGDSKEYRREQIFDRVFGAGKWRHMFLETGLDHAGVVRLVMVTIADLGGAPVCPLAFGMPPEGAGNPDDVEIRNDWNMRGRPFR